jgi:hypothetical protein
MRGIGFKFVRPLPGRWRRLSFQAGCLFVALIYSSFLIWMLGKLIRIAGASIDLGRLLEVVKKGLRVP